MEQTRRSMGLSEMAQGFATMARSLERANPDISAYEVRSSYLTESMPGAIRVEAVREKRPTSWLSFAAIRSAMSLVIVSTGNAKLTKLLSDEMVACLATRPPFTPTVTSVLEHLALSEPAYPITSWDTAVADVDAWHTFIGEAASGLHRWHRGAAMCVARSRAEQERIADAWESRATIRLEEHRRSDRSSSLRATMGELYSHKASEPTSRLIRNPRDAELVAADWMTYWGFEGTAVSPVGMDGGIDVESDTAVAQVKAHMVPIGRPDIQMLYGVASSLRKRPIFIALQGYTAHALNWAEEHGVALFVFDLQGAPSPVNGHARSIAAGS